MLLWLGILAVLFLLVLVNTRRNNTKVRQRKNRDFRTNYNRRKIQRTQETISEVADSKKKDT